MLPCNNNLSFLLAVLLYTVFYISHMISIGDTMRFLVLLIFIFLTACAPHQIVKTQDQKKLIVKITSNFYNNYMEYVFNTCNQSLVEYLYAQKEIDHTFVKKIEGMIEEAKKNLFLGGSLGGDPIFLAQDIPRGIRYSIPAVKQKNASIKVLTNYGGDEDDYQPTIIVQLIQVEKTWKIIDIYSPP